MFHLEVWRRALGVGITHYDVVSRGVCHTYLVVHIMVTEHLEVTPGSTIAHWVCHDQYSQM
jgi:hypothetical protein